MSSNMIAGYHDMYWSPAGISTAVTIGSTGPEGLYIETTPNVHEITGDVLGPATVVDGVYQGVNGMIQGVMQEVKLAMVKQFLRPFTATNAAPELQEIVGVPGILFSSVAGTLELIPRAGTPAASYKSSGGNGRRFIGLCIGPVRENMDTNPRFIPFTFRCLPFDDAGTLKMWKWITAANA